MAVCLESVNNFYETLFECGTVRCSLTFIHFNSVITNMSSQRENYTSDTLRLITKSCRGVYLLILLKLLETIIVLHFKWTNILQMKLSAINHKRTDY
jgi:hypothetical protein